MLSFLIALSRISAFGRRLSYGLRGVLCAFLFAGVPAFAATTTTTLAVTSSGSAATTVASGSVVTLTATVNSGAGAVTTGLVNFCDATAAYCTDIHIVGMAQLTSTGAATLTFVPGIGSHSYKAVFVRTTSNSASTSSASSLTVTGTYPTATTITQSGNAGNYTLTATVSGAGATVPTGTVSFLDTSNANQVLGTAVPLGTGLQGLSLTSLSTPVTGINPGSVAAVADFNGDGKLDIVTVNNGTLTLLLGNGDGTFMTGVSSVTSFSPGAVVVGDFNGDGKADLAVSSGVSDALVVLLGNGDGTFTESSPSAIVDTTSGIGPIVVGDFNGDGKSDVAVTNQRRMAGIPYTVSVGLGNGDGTFTAAPNAFEINAPADIATGDFNGDGKLDVVVADSGSDLVRVLLGNGDGTFSQSASPLTIVMATGIAVADFNGDGKPDLVITSYGNVGVWLGNGDGTFTATPSANLPVGSVAVGDFNNDGKPDLAITTSNSTINLLLGKGDGTFTAALSQSTNVVPGSIALGDFNGDGLPDLAATNRSGYTVTVTVLLAQLAQATAVVNGISPVGTGVHLVRANYPGDGNYGPSVSNMIGLTALSTTTLTLMANPASSTFGQQVVLTATLSPYTAQGQSSDLESVTFYNGTANLGIGALVSGVATLNLTSLPAGTNSLSAIYGGDANLDPATSNTISYTVLGVPTIAFTVANHTYGDAPFSISATSNSTGAITYSVVSGPATISGSTVTLTGVAGSVVLQASQAAAGSYAAGTKTASFTVNKAQLTITANNAVRVFGAANPSFTGTVTGSVNGDTFAETFSTTATAASIVGAYSIVPSVTGTNLGNYTVGAVNGVLTISQAGTATIFALSNQNLTLTATVASLISGVPTGTVSFYEGQTLVGTGTLSNGTASYTASSFPTGNVVVSAQYSGDANFTQSSSPPILVLSVTPTSTALSVAQSGSVTDAMTLSPVPGYTGTVQLSCGNLPPAATCSFQPSSVAFTGTNNSASVTVTIQTGVSTQGAVLPLLPGRSENRAGVLAAVVWMPGLFIATIARRRRTKGTRLDKLLLLTLLCGIAAGLTACGGSLTPSSGSTGQTPTGAYTVRVVASGPNGLSQTTNLNLTVQ
jgi:hypothetical protein